MAKSRKSHKAGRRHTRRQRAGAFKTIATACRAVLKAKNEDAAVKIFEGAMSQFSDAPGDQLDVLNLCLRAKGDKSLEPEAREKAAELEKGLVAGPPAPSSPATTIRSGPSPVTITSSQEDMMEIDTEPPAAAKPVQYDEQGDVIMADGGRKKRKTRKGGRKHKKNTRRH